ncbi:MbcA/ParS/Xre antitoxin family protein [Deinococcus sp. QL22]|uniref:MbcA/ParS/Xre antitoxin family protein n=1 Tax=Deinococcus sp. QL22 TaxID=2939437 RepID=UPI002016C0EB|nr:MbcA/ParS/Xre antitoxin family protein [Deinococcus sp. QL22]UQN10645.1 MbcA/ParS/Xre antitoxin family protein [Deinococcus sp. QL22]
MTGPDSHTLLTETRHPETGQLDAHRVAQTLGLTWEELGQVLNGNSPTLPTVPPSDDLHPLDALAHHLRDVFGSLDTARIWLRVSNPVLDDEAPVAFLTRGDLMSIHKLLRLAESGTPT